MALFRVWKVFLCVIVTKIYSICRVVDTVEIRGRVPRLSVKTTKLRGQTRQNWRHPVPPSHWRNKIKSRYNKFDMPWFEERSLFVGYTQIRRYEPGVCEGRVDVDSQSYGRLVPLEAGRDGIVHGHRLVRQHVGERKKKKEKHKHTHRRRARSRFRDAGVLGCEPIVALSLLP